MVVFPSIMLYYCYKRNSCIIYIEINIQKKQNINLWWFSLVINLNYYWIYFPPIVSSFESYPKQIDNFIFTFVTFQ